MPRGASPKRERQFEHIKESAKKSGRYGRRAEEVAARTVNKTRREKGETKTQISRSKKASTRSASSKERSTKSRTRSPKSSTKRSRRTSTGGRGFAGASHPPPHALAPHAAPPPH